MFGCNGCIRFLGWPGRSIESCRRSPIEKGALAGAIPCASMTRPILNASPTRAICRSGAACGGAPTYYASRYSDVLQRKCHTLRAGALLPERAGEMVGRAKRRVGALHLCLRIRGEPSRPGLVVLLTRPICQSWPASAIPRWWGRCAQFSRLHWSAVGKADTSRAQQQKGEINFPIHNGMRAGRERAILMSYALGGQKMCAHFPRAGARSPRSGEARERSPSGLIVLALVGRYRGACWQGWRAKGGN